jgi:hypothetical protein
MWLDSKAAVEAGVCGLQWDSPERKGNWDLHDGAMDGAHTVVAIEPRHHSCGGQPLRQARIAAGEGGRFGEPAPRLGRAAPPASPTRLGRAAALVSPHHSWGGWL